MEDEEYDCVEVVGTCCGSGLKDVDPEDDGDGVDVAESCSGSCKDDSTGVVDTCCGSELDVVDPKEVGDCDEVWAAAARLVV